VFRRIVSLNGLLEFVICHFRFLFEGLELFPAFFRLFQNADQKATESWEHLQTLKQERKMTDDELKEQAVLMRQFYETQAENSKFAHIPLHPLTRP
jgi:hypothetical protein